VCESEVIGGSYTSVAHETLSFVLIPFFARVPFIAETNLGVPLIEEFPATELLIDDSVTPPIGKACDIKSTFTKSSVESDSRERIGSSM